jgi:DNA-binding response OmpR family regulator
MFFCFFFKNSKVQHINDIDHIIPDKIKKNSLNYTYILIVDDSIVFSKILKQQLMHNYEYYYIDIVTDGNDAYLLLKEYVLNYDILIIDIFMPSMYGTELVKLIRQELNSMIPIIVLSSIPEFGRQTLDLGANLFFEKGYPIDRLKEHIANLIENN